MNLFLATRSLTDQREDHLTEFLCAALEHAPRFRAGYTDLVVAPLARKRAWGAVQIAAVRTQVDFADTGCRPDLVLELSNGKVILCEHKLLAPQTLGSEEDPRPQLERYLDLPADGLAYVRSSWRPPGDAVLTHDKYIRPAEREHFLWQDLFPLLVPGEHVITDWLREGFEALNFTPPRPKVGALDLRGTRDQLDDAFNFAKLWGRTKSIAYHRRCRIQTGSRVELYLWPTGSCVTEVFLSPANPGRFLFRATPREGMFEAAREALERTASALAAQPDVSVARLKRAAGIVNVLDVVTTLDSVLPSTAESTEQMEARLVEYVEPLLVALGVGRGTAQT